MDGTGAVVAGAADAVLGRVRVRSQASEVNTVAATRPPTRPGMTQAFQPLNDIMNRKLAAIKSAIVIRRRKKYCAMSGE